MSTNRYRYTSVEKLDVDEEFMYANHQFASAQDVTDTFDPATHLHPPECLTPTSQGVWMQWVKDAKHSLLVGGFFREMTCLSRLHLPGDVNRIIGAYYAKSLSKRRLKEKWLQRGTLSRYMFGI